MPMSEREFVQQAKTLHESDDYKISTTPLRRMQMSQFEVEIFETAREVELKRKESGVVTPVPIHMIHFNCRKPTISKEARHAMTQIVDRVMRNEFRIDPDNQDYKLEWIGTKGSIGDVGISSFCLSVAGLHYDPEAPRRLIRAAVLINEGFSRAAGSRVNLPL